MESARVPGLAISIVEGNQVVYSEGFGVASVDSGLRVTPETLFRIASTTKPLTGTAIMRLVEAAKLHLDTPVTEMVPWISIDQEGSAEKVTIRRLLSHTAGLGGEGIEYGPREPDGLERLVREDIPKRPLVAPPGKLFSYSNYGINLAGFIAQWVTDRSYAELMDELVFKPLSMTRTTFDPLVAATFPLAQSHDVDESANLQVRRRFAENSKHYPAGFAISNVLDLANFATMHINKGKFGSEQILTEESVAEMHKPQADLLNVASVHYGLTFGVDRYKGLRRVWHSGSIGTYASRFLLFPDERVAVCMLFNRFTPEFPAESIIMGLIDRLLDLPIEVTPPTPIAPEKQLWPLFAGKYHGLLIGTAEVLQLEDDLVLNLNDDQIRLVPIKRNVYLGRREDNGDPLSLGFVLEEEGPCRYLMLNGQPCRRVQPGEEFVPDRSRWPMFAGSYSGIERLTVRAEDEQLFVHFKSLDQEFPAKAISPDRFMTPKGLIEFHVTEDGVVSYAELGHSYMLERVEQ